jgi:hypothetical protein
MAIIEEINKSHISIRAISISLFLVPFWYLSVFLFGNEFYISADNFVVLAFCLVLSISSSVLFYLFIEKTGGFEKTTEPMLNCMSVSIILLSVWLLLLLIFTTYSFDFLFNQKIFFYWFIVIYFIPILVLNLLVLVLGVDKKNYK